MNRLILYHEGADVDTAEVREYYEAREAGLGDEFVRALQAAISTIQANPKLYGVARLGVRVAPLRRFPQLVFYRLMGPDVQVVAVQHGRRSARGWRDRL